MDYIQFINSSFLINRKYEGISPEFTLYLSFVARPSGIPFRKTEAGNSSKKRFFTQGRAGVQAHIFHQ
jgi:hypothetical protein